jgi:HK97 family phage prohead protease
MSEETSPAPDFSRIARPDRERRFAIASELRASPEKRQLEGYAAIFNVPSEDLGGFVERIAPEFFAKVLGDDVRALVNHDPNLVLGRTKSQPAATLRIGTDSKGLHYQIDLPDTQTARDLLESVRRGDISQSSFGFSTAADAWKKVDGKWVRTLLEASRLYDVSPVTYPAYPQTEASARSLAEELRKITIPAAPVPGVLDAAARETERRRRELRLRGVR